MTLQQTDVLSEEYTAAFTSAQRFRNLMLGIVLITILAPIAAAVLGIFFDVLGLGGKATDNVCPGMCQAATCPASAPASAPAAALRHGASWRPVLSGLLLAGQIFGPGAAVLVAVTLLMTINLAFIGRTRGLPWFISAFFWTAILAVILVPWQLITKNLMFGGVCFTMRELNAAITAMGGTWYQKGQLFARFVMFPATALLVWMLVVAKCHIAGKRLRHVETPAAGNTPTQPQ